MRKRYVLGRFLTAGVIFATHKRFLPVPGAGPHVRTVEIVAKSDGLFMFPHILFTLRVSEPLNQIHTKLYTDRGCCVCARTPVCVRVGRLEGGGGRGVVQGALTRGEILPSTPRLTG